MAPTAIPAVLRERLGERGSFELMELLYAREADWSERMLNVAAERFERRLSEEIASVRVDMSTFRSDMHQGFATTKVEILRWSFMFWIGQVAAMAGLLAFMFRMLPGR